MTCIFGAPFDFIYINAEEEKEPYESSAKRDKTRYTSEMAEYKSGGKTSAAAPTGNVSSDEASSD